MSVSNLGSRQQTAVAHHGPRTFATTATDPRADGALRQVLVERRHVLIERRVAGIAMRIGIATEAYRGVGLSLATTASGNSVYRVSLVHRDLDLNVELYNVQDEDRALTEWQAWAAYFGLAALVEREPGRFKTTEAPVGRAIAGRGLKLRRRGATLSKRRPRIRLRRKTPARLQPPEVKRGREIIAYE